MRRARPAPPPTGSTDSRSGGWRAALDPRAPYLVPVLAMPVCRLALAFAIPRAGEDAYITFRYAWNWAHGLGPVFNAGERVLGVTSLPWTAWIALGVRWGADPVLWSRATLLVADAVALVCFAALLEAHVSRASAWCFAVFFAAWPYFSGLFCSGLEIGALLACIAATTWLIDRRSSISGPALGLLATFRPEGLLAAAVLAVWARGRDRIVAAGIFAAAAIAIALYYGSPVPQSVLAKVAAYGVPGPLHAAQWWEWALPIPLPFNASTAESSNLFTIAVLASPAAFAGALALRTRLASPLVGAVAALSAIWLALLITGASFFFWYFAMPLVAWTLLGSIGLPRIAGTRLIYTSLVLMISGHWLYEGNLYVGRAKSESQLFGRTAEYIDSRAHRGESVLLEPAGVVGWQCITLRVMDDIGLVTPMAVVMRRRGAGWYADLLSAVRPDWLVVRAGLLRGRSAFAGRNAPFRDMDEGRRSLAPYEFMTAGDSTAGDQALIIFHRHTQN